MKKTLLAFVGVACLPLFGIEHALFETESFNRSTPASYAKNFVFSPVSFEADCVLMAESLATIPKANVAEKMDVLFGFPSLYRPLLATLHTPADGFSFLSARGFCIPRIQEANMNHRLHLEREYGAEVMRLVPPEGAEAWFRATVAGQMESFEISSIDPSLNKYSLYDLASVRVAWRDPFPTDNTRTLAFYSNGPADSVLTSFMSDVRAAATWEEAEGTFLKLPLKGNCSFYALLPREGTTLADARKAMTGERVKLLLALTGPEATEARLSPCALVLPRFDILSKTDMQGIFSYFQIPLSSLVLLSDNMSPHEMIQWTRFTLAEHAWDEQPLQKKRDDEVIALTPDVKRLVFNRPFLFFVYHEETRTILAMGQFTGH